MSSNSLSKSSNRKITFDPNIVEILQTLDPEIELREFDRSGPISSWEWAVPAGVVLVLAKPFFDAFMKKLGDAAGDVVVHAIKKQYRASMSGNEKLLNREALDELQRRSNDFEGDDETWREHTDDIGKKIAPFEIRLSKVAWRAPSGRDLIVNYRFVFTADLGEEACGLALRALAEYRVDLLKQLPKDFPHLLIASQQETHVAGTVEAVFDATEGDWVSFPTMRNRLRD
jgi:hypothetical protein